MALPARKAILIACKSHCNQEFAGRDTMVRKFLATTALFCLFSNAPAYPSAATSEQLAASDAEFRKALAEIKEKKYQPAIDRKMKIYTGTGADADLCNELGFAHRKLGHLDKSLTYYKEALELEPDHLEAHEYLGELYLMMNRPDDAKKELATLTKLCGACEQQKELAEAIGKY